MKKGVTFLVAGSLAVLVSTGCNKKTDTNSALEQAVQVMEQAESSQAAPVSVPQQTTVTTSPTAPAQAAPAVATTSVAQQMNQAVAAYKGGHYVDAVTRLQQLRALTGKTPEQTLALQEAIAAVMAELYTRASKGDTRAQTAVKEYERIQNARQ